MKLKRSLNMRIGEENRSVRITSSMVTTTQVVPVNNFDTTLAAPVTSADTVLILSTSAGLPTLAAGQTMRITLNDAASGLLYEICEVTSIAGSTLTVTRAQEGTSALNWSVGDYAYSALTAKTTAASTGNPNNTFMVATATDPTHATPLAQVQALGGVPIGSSIMFRGDTPPNGFLVEDGRELFRDEFAALFAVIGVLYGAGDSLTTFNIPDMRRCTNVGSGGTGTAVLGNEVGNRGGQETHALTEAENGPHAHTPLTGVPKFLIAEGTAGVPVGELIAGSEVRLSQDTAISGLGAPHNNIQPSLVGLSCIRAF